MSRRLTYSRNAVTPTVGNDLMTIIGAANRRIRVWEISISGAHTASAPATVEVGRSTGGTTGGGALAPMEHIDVTDTVGAVVNTTWSAQPTLASEGRLQLGCNALGGNYRWTAFHPDHAIELNGTQQLSIRPSLGTNPLNIHAVIEEL